MIASKKMKLILAPIGVATGIVFWIMFGCFVTAKFGWPQPSEILGFLPGGVQLVLGLVLLAFWLPVFAVGFYCLGRRGAVGQADTLVVNGIYKYVRNPMYSGVSFCLAGLGLVLDRTGVILAGGAWFLLAYPQSLREQKELLVRFGGEYARYRKTTPMFIPSLAKVVKELMDKRGRLMRRGDGA